MSWCEKKKIQALYALYHSPLYLGIDPLITLQGFTRPQDLEAGALVASVLAYGRVETIISHIEEVFFLMDMAPSTFVVATSYEEKRARLRTFRHRFTTGEDLALFLQAIAVIISEAGSVEMFFLQAVDRSGGDIGAAIDLFCTKVKSGATRIHGNLPGFFSFLVPSPKDGSACKRMNMYLRWMIRPADGIDFGAWKSLTPSILMMPVDTHIAKIARQFGMTRRVAADWKMATEITAYLRQVDRDDPVRFDFSLCRSGMVALRRSAA